MTNTFRIQPKNYRWLYVLGTSLPFLTLMIFAGYRLYCVMALQNSVFNAYRISIRDAERINSMSGWKEDLINYLSAKAKEREIKTTESSKERLRAFLLSKDDAIGISNPEGFSENFEEALGRFPRLRLFELYDNQGDKLTEKDTNILFGGLRRMERLEVIHLYSQDVTDTSFARLAGHPTLRRVHFGLGAITPEIAATLKTMPKLKKVELAPNLQVHGAWKLPETQQGFLDSLPGVQIEFSAR